MKSNKLVMILSSLVILMMCLSVVSAAVENSGDESNGITNLGDSKIITHFDLDGPIGNSIVISLKDSDNNGLASQIIKCTLVKDGELVGNQFLVTDEFGNANFNFNFTPGSYIFNCTFEGAGEYAGSNESYGFTQLIPTKFYVDVQPFGENILSAQLVSEKGPLANTPISVALYDAKGEFIKDTPMTTNEDGLVEYDLSKLSKGKYSAIFYFEGNDNYDPTTSDKIPFTVEDKNPIHKKDPKDVDMKDTGLPIIALVLGLLAVAGIGYRKY